MFRKWGTTLVTIHGHRSSYRVILGQVCARRLRESPRVSEKR